MQANTNRDLPEGKIGEQSGKAAMRPVRTALAARALGRTPSGSEIERDLLTVRCPGVHPQPGQVGEDGREKGSEAHEETPPTNGNQMRRTVVPDVVSPQPLFRSTAIGQEPKNL